MENEKLINELMEIKLSIIENATDTMFMRGETSTTICDEIDGILIGLGVDEDLLENQYEVYEANQIKK